MTDVSSVEDSMSYMTDDEFSYKKRIGVWEAEGGTVPATYSSVPTTNPDPSNIVFVAYRKAGISTDSPLWEYAAIKRVDGEPDEEFIFMLRHDDSNVTQLARNLAADHDNRYRPAKASDIYDFNKNFQKVFSSKGWDSKVHLVGLDVHGFEAVLDKQFMTGTHEWQSLVSFGDLAAGYLRGRGRVVELPWDLEKISQVLGVQPIEYDRLTSLGEVRWVRDMFDAM